MPEVVRIRDLSGNMEAALERAGVMAEECIAIFWGSPAVGGVVFQVQHAVTGEVLVRSDPLRSKRSDVLGYLLEHFDDVEAVD